jgi:hypothetical protein
MLVTALLLALAPEPQSIRYRIELVDPLEPIVALHVECTGDADGTTEQSLGWSGFFLFTTVMVLPLLALLAWNPPGRRKV